MLRDSKGLRLRFDYLDRFGIDRAFKSLRSPTRLSEISIKGSDFSALNEDIIATTLSKITSVKLYSTVVTCQQWTAIFSQMRKSSITKDLILSRTIVYSVPAKELAKGLVA